MTNHELLKQIERSINAGDITEADVQAVLSGVANTSSGSTSSQMASRSKTRGKDSTNALVTKVLFGIGGLIAVIGVAVLIGQNWEVIGAAGRIISTLGIAAVAYALAMLSFKKDKAGESSVYFAISAALAPIGIFILLNEAGLIDSLDGSASHIIVSLASLAIFTSALIATKKSILHIINGIFATWLIYACVAELIRGSGFNIFFMKDIFAYTSMIIALGYLSYGSWVKTRFGVSKVSHLFTLAAFALFLGAGLFLGGIWNLFYAFIAVGAVALSIQLRSTPALLVTALAIVVYIIKISAQYFSDSVGWALLLVLIGFLIIGLGYATYYLNKKYIHEENTGR